MELLKVLIVDDEKIARDRIKRFLQNFPQKLEVLEAENGLVALEKINHSKPDIVLLDIQMPQMSGFDVLFQLPERHFQVIFQTAFDEFAVKAFEVNACDYLLKPFTEERLFNSLTKAMIAKSQQEQIQKLQKHLEKSHVYLKSLVSKTGAQTKILRVEDILFFKSEDHYTFAVTENSECIVDISLQNLEEKLDPGQFIRTHRSHIVKLAAIEKVGGVQEAKLNLINGHTIPVSRESRKKLLELFEKA